MSILGLTTTVIATWEAYTVVFVTVLTNGGPVSLVCETRNRTCSR